MSKVNTLRFDRPFQLWAYSVSHSQLLLRSTPSERHPSRVEILFKDVRAMLVRDAYPFLRIRPPLSGDETTAIEIASGIAATAHSKYHVIEGEPLSFVVAAEVAHAEDQGTYSDPSPLFVTTGM